MNSTLDTAAGYLAAQSLQVAFVFLLVFAACWVLRKASAHWRYLLWLVVIAKCLTPPIVALPLPVLPTEVARHVSAAKELPALLASDSAPHTEEKIEVNATTSLGAQKPVSDRLVALDSVQAITATRAARSIQFTVWQLLTMAWIAIAGILLAMLVGKMWATRRQLHRLRAEADDDSQRLISGLAKSLGFKRAPQVYEIESAVQPFVWGWLWGEIYLPRGFSRSGSPEERRAILTHELAHVSRWDVTVNHLQNFVQAVFFFHPLVWFANRRLRQEREKCCDEMVLSSPEASPKAYCEAIVELLARECAASGATPGLAVTGSARNIKERISTMLAPGRRFFRRPSRLTVVSLVVFAGLVLPTALLVTSQKNEAVAGEQDANEKDAAAKAMSFKWKLVDEASNPVEGVKVSAVALRSKEHTAAGIAWPGPQDEYVTDKNGEIHLEYPAKFRDSGQWVATSSIYFRFSHPDFVAGATDVDLTLGTAKQALSKGCKAVFRAQDEGGATNHEIAALLPPQAMTVAWRSKNGEVSSGGIPPGKLQTLIVSPAANGAHRFSDLLVLNYALDRETKITDVELRPGMKVRGVLSANVPRPVKHGSVQVWCMPKPAGGYSSEEPTLGWAEEAAIAEDGSFEFPSLPRGGTIQFIALCDGWVVKGLEHGLVTGKEVTITEAQLAANLVEDVVLPMTATGSIELRVIDPDGKPLAGAIVRSWPNQSIKHSGNTVLSYCYPSLRLVESQIAGTAIPKGDLTKITRYNLKTDEHGKAVISDIPLRAPQWLYVGFDNLTMKADWGYGEKSFEETKRIECKSAERRKLTVQMYRIPNAKSAGAKPASESDQKLDVTMNKPELGFDVKLLSTEEMLKALTERKVSVSPEAKSAILEYVDGLASAPDEVKKSVGILRDGADSLSFQDFAPLLHGAPSIATIFARHDDRVMRFAATVVMASQGVANAAQDLHEQIHDNSLSKADRQLIFSWCNGVGIRATDSPKDIADHFANVTRTQPKFKKGDVAPDFELVTVSGEKLASKDLRGKVIVLHFWATSCGPCMSDMPRHIAKLKEHDPKQVEIVFVSLDDEKDKFIEAVKQNKIPFKNVRDERGWGGELARLFGVRSLPFDVVIDREGKFAANSIELLSESAETPEK